jgi:hypothetical protein
MNFLRNLSHYIFVVILFLISLLPACTDHIDPENSTPADEIKAIETLKLPAELVLPDQPNGYTVAPVYFAKGVQKYKAQIKAGSNPETYEWAFVAPEADLYDIHNAKIGMHFAGPSWKITASSDLIMSQAFSPVKAVNVATQSIDWLLLMVKSGTTPTGIFENVDYIHRLKTKGGQAPSTPPTSLSQTADVPYTAVYVFSKINL